MDTRRDFFKQVALLTGGTGLASVLLPAIDKAASIEPAPESDYLQAEHVVILMQENRSFDHCFGALRGVRGFNDPRAITLPDGNPVWLQTNTAGETYCPFHLDAQTTNATWLGSLPHSWADQVDAKNGGDHDKWLVAKPAGGAHPTGMPLTMGYYDREDLPFYYALADAFTVCDSHFCSSLTGTTPNRLYLWSGTIREEQHAGSPAHVRNENVDFDKPARWTTFPERLEDSGVSWKIYQNELSIPSGLNEQQDAWLGNFTDNPIEWFPQFAVQFSPAHRAYLKRLQADLPAEIEALEQQITRSQSSEQRMQLARDLDDKRTILREVASRYSATGSFDDLPEHSRRLHRNAFVTNADEADYRTLTPLRYEDSGSEEELEIPKGDVLHQFRQDVKSDELPTVSWIVAPEKFSDHPTSPWYGAWYVAEVMNILTNDPQVWKKTIFILTYDENDGFFDHVPPFGSPNPDKPETGSVSSGIDAAVEYVTLEQDQAWATSGKARESSIGLGFRVPTIVASPWSRGGAVCSQVFDHTSVLQFLEKFTSHKSGKTVRESNISEWRRTVCGDLTTVFQTATTKTPRALPYPDKDAFLECIHKAKEKPLPHYQSLSAQQIAAASERTKAISWMPRQEPGVRPACPLPYELHAAGGLHANRAQVVVTLSARNENFGDRSAGAPFHVYAPKQYLHKGSPNRNRCYALTAGQSLQDNWQLDGFGDGRYHLCVGGPNGFLFELAGDGNDPLIQADAVWGKRQTRPQLLIRLANSDTTTAHSFSIVHHAYGYKKTRKILQAGANGVISLDLSPSYGWYDFSVRTEGFPQFHRHYAGHVETGHPSFSDPHMGGLV